MKIKKLVLFSLLIVILFAGCANNSINIKETPKKQDYIGVPAVILLENTNVKVNPNGSTITTIHKAVKVFNLRGRKKYSSISDTYYSDYSKVSFDFIKIYKPNGKIIKISKKDIKDIPYPAFGKFFLPKLRIKKVELSDLEDNCVIEWQITENLYNAPMKNNFWALTMFQGYEPILKKKYSVVYPKSMGVKYEIANDSNHIIKKEEKENKGMIYLTFSASNVPAIIGEPFMPNYVNVFPRVILSSIKSWKKFSQWGASIAEPQMKVTDKVRKKVEELIKDKKTMHDKMFAIYRFVTDKVRYVETNMVGKKGGFKPYSADYILDKMYGVCRDKAALLVTMFRSIGVDAYWVLTNPVFKLNTKLPYDYFNHAIVAIKTKDGFTFLDPTAEKTDMVLPEMEKDKDALVCTYQGETLQNTGKIDPNVNKLATIMDINLNKKLGGSVKISMIAYGDLSSSFRMLSSMLTNEFKKQFFQTIVTQFSKDAKVDLNKSKIEIPDDYNKPAKIIIYFKSNKLLKRSGKYYLLNLGSSSNLSRQTSFFSLSKRKYPLQINSAMKYLGKVSITYPRILKIDTLPDEINYNSKIIKITSKNINKRNQVIIKSQMVMIPGIISPKEYPEEKAKFDKFSKKNTEILFIKRRFK